MDGPPQTPRGDELAGELFLKMVESKGRSIVFATEGSEELRYLQSTGANANVGGETLRHVLLLGDARKIEVWEEFLHGTQYKLGLVDRLGVMEAERHVKSFMIRHRRLLGISVSDVMILKILLGAPGDDETVPAES